MSMNTPTLFTFLDTRETLGATLIWDEEVLVHCMAAAELLPRNFNLRLTTPTPEQVDCQYPGKFEFDMEDGNCTVELLVSDRLEFSPKALKRINRSLATLIRAAATHQNAVDFFGLVGAEVMYAASNGIVDRLSYAWAKVWAEAHDGMLMLKVEEPAVLAE